MPIRKPIRNGKLEVEHMNLARVQGKPGDKRNKIGSHWRQVALKAIRQKGVTWGKNLERRDEGSVVEL